MQELITRSWNGFEIEFELIDGQLMANATSMCAAFGKRPGDWTKTGGAKRFMEAKGKKIVLADNQLLYVRNGGNDNGTWIHECLIRKLAEWLDVDFEVQCDEWMTELLRTGKVELQRPLSAAEIVHAQSGVLVEHEHRMLALEQANGATQKQIAAVEQKIDEVAARQVLTAVEYFAIKGWASLQKKTVTEAQAQDLGRKAGKLSRERGIPIEKMPHGNWGFINSYHRSILQDVF